jgi:tetratricopeptide (TPR) repeat protein
MFREGVTLFGLTTKTPATQAWLSGVRATCLLQQSDFSAARDAALEVFRTRGEVWARANARHALGGVEHARGAYAQARRHYERAMALWERVGSTLNASFTAASLALLHFAHGERRACARSIKQAFGLSRESGNAQCMLLMQMLAGDLALAEERLAAARLNYERALRLEAADWMPHVKTSVLRRLGALMRRSGDGAAALAHHREALELAAGVGEPRSQAHALIEIGQDHAALGEIDAARAALIEGLRLSLSLNMAPLIGQGLIALARLELAVGARNRALAVASALATPALAEHQEALLSLLADLGCRRDALPPARAVGDILNDIADGAQLDILD